MSLTPEASLVRPARPTDADRIGLIHAAGLRRQVGAGLGLGGAPGLSGEPGLGGGPDTAGEPDPVAVPQISDDGTLDLAGIFDPAEIAAQWSSAILTPPSARHQVLVALEEGAVVGFAAIAPLAGGGAAAAAVPEIDAEILALETDPALPADTHAARLLNACADVLALAGARTVRVWAFRGDDARQRLLAAAGFAPVGMRRRYEVAGRELVEDAWWAALGSDQD